MEVGLIGAIGETVATHAVQAPKREHETVQNQPQHMEEHSVLLLTSKAKPTIALDHVQVLFIIA